MPRTTGSAERVSVVIPVRDGERYLGAAIESVLAQSHAPHEVVVVDDGSTDGSAAVGRAFGAPVIVVSQPAEGVSAAVNRGAEEATGELLAFLDADDLWPAGKLERQVAVLGERPDLGAVFGHAEHFADDRSAVRDGIQPAYTRGTMLIRRAAFEAAGPFSVEWRLGEFVEWYARALDRGLRSLMLPEVALLRRVHDSNTGVKLRDDRVEYTRMLKSVLDRRRAEQGPA